MHLLFSPSNVFCVSSLLCLTVLMNKTQLYIRRAMQGMNLILISTLTSNCASLIDVKVKKTWHFTSILSRALMTDHRTYYFFLLHILMYWYRILDYDLFHQFLLYHCLFENDAKIRAHKIIALYVFFCYIVVSTLALLCNSQLQVYVVVWCILCKVQ